MVHPEFSSLLPVAIGVLPAISAAIFKLRGSPQVETIQTGRGDVTARQEKDPAADTTYIGVPTGSLVQTELGKNDVLVALDYREKVGSRATIQIRRGESRHEAEAVDTFTEQGVYEVGDVSLRYLGSVSNKIFKHYSLKELYEKGLGQSNA